MSKISITGLEARNKAIQGMDYVADAVKSTIGPFGLNFLLEKGNKVTNDGYNIAAELAPTIVDEYERRGALVAQEASSKTNDMVGDFTSGTWALTQALIKEAVRYLPTEKTIKAKKTPAEIINMIHVSKDEVIKRMEEITKTVTSKEELIKSALVSVEDEKVAEMLGSMQWDLGPEGRIIAEEVNAGECSIEKMEGIMLDNGFVSSNLVTNPETQTLEIKTPIPIILTNHVVGEPEMKLLRENIFKTLVTQQKTGCIVMARAFTKEAIQETQENMATFGVLLLNAPYTDQAEVMRDIEAVVGGRYIDVEEGSLRDIYITDVGCAKSLVARQYKSHISGQDDEQSKARIEKRVEVLKKKLIGSESDFEKRMIAERIAQLQGGFAILKVGSRSVTNRKRLKDKCDDAVNSVRYALKGGTINGAGRALKEISEGMDEGNILKRPLIVIHDQIVNSAPEGWEIPEWVRDPFLTIKVGLENACDLAGTFATTNGIITTENESKCKCEK